ncbi:MAG: alpha/beta family hydrolase [Thermoanaerobaculia bacterium]
MRARALDLRVSERLGRVSGLWLEPSGAEVALVLAHGAGAGMRHRFLEELASALAERGVATLRYQFPYSEKGRGRPDPPTVLVHTVEKAVAAARELTRLPLFAGGKSMGGRMSSTAVAEKGLPGLSGLVFFGFPLHPAGKPATTRAEHLAAVEVPMLFLQGDRDRLAELDLLRPVLEPLGHRALLHVVEGADHGFHVLKRSGRDDADVLTELADTAAAWMRPSRPRIAP